MYRSVMGGSWNGQDGRRGLRCCEVSEHGLFSEQGKLEAGKKPENGGESHLSGARFVRRRVIPAEIISPLTDPYEAKINPPAIFFPC